MASTPQSNQSSTPPEIEQFFDLLAGPLLDRCRLGRPSLGLAYYEGESVDPRWHAALDAWCRARGLFVELAVLADLGDHPAEHLTARRRVGEYLFSLEIRDSDLPDPAVGEAVAVADLNFHRDTFRDEGVSLLLWIPRPHARRFMDRAANLAEYRTTNADVPHFPEPAMTGLQPAELAQPRAKHNLPIASLGEQFVGREHELQELRETLLSRGQGAITDALALEGLGGIGKTRLALEYAWQHLDDYDQIFFLRADTPEVARANIAGLVSEQSLNLPEAAAPEEDVRVAAVLNWFRQHDDWLLVLDNADAENSADYVSTELIPHLDRGHVLLTSRYRRWGGQVRSIVLSPLPPPEAVNLLIQSIGEDRPASNDDSNVALDIARAVGYLPLALEQIAAWVRDRHCTLAEALQAIADESQAVLDWYDEREIRYPRPVAAVWAHAVEPLNDEQQFLLRFLAWLAPSPVPDFVVRAVSQIWPPSEQSEPDFLDVARTLARHSLLTARSDRSFQLHRLWLELERRRTPPDERQTWNARIAAILAKVTPFDTDDVRTWPRVQLIEASAVELFNRTENLAHRDNQPSQLWRDLTTLLNQFGLYFKVKAQFGQAEPRYRRALEINEQAYGKEHAEVAICLNNLATLLQATNRLEEAEPLMRRALQIDEQAYGKEHPEVATDLNNLAALLQATNRLEEAEPLMRRALAIGEQSYGAEHPRVAVHLNNLAQLLQATNRLAEAEPLMRRALAIGEQSYGAEHPKVAIRLNNLAALLQYTNRLVEAEPLMRRALAIDEQSYGAEHPNVAIRLNNLAQLLKATNRLAEAEPLMRRALAIFRSSLGDEHPNTLWVEGTLADLRKEQGGGGE